MPVPAVPLPARLSAALWRVRRNHGLEHASIHMLTRRRLGPVMGHSDARGFWLVGELNTEDVRAAVDEALGRLRAGERGLAIHPNCGTNLVTSGLLAGAAGAAAMAGAGPRRRDRLGRLPVAGFLATLALLAARPLGTRLQQRVTTSGDPASLELLDIRRTTRGNLTAHRVTTIS
ncbi:MAG: hypothetical protein DWG76_07895 [Chloroflexi bacterium]|nr:hypothetical protein [Chloroflexota bacterium]